MGRVEEIKAEIHKLRQELELIQSECCHPVSSMTGKAHANTGNWDPDDDRYWYSFTCGLCEKHWTEDQSKSLYSISNGKVSKRK
jgi:hypothetical protein